MTSRRCTALVIGGGASGTLTATHLLRTTPYHVVLVELRARLGRGIAYDTTDDRHLLNSRADTMSADSARPTDFLDWCHAHGLAGGPGSFQPRHAYGDYLLDTLTAADRSAGGRLTRVHGSVTRLRRGPGGLTAGLADGRPYRADLAVLAVGHAPPADPAAIVPQLRHHPRYVADPWRPGALDRVPAEAPTLLVGTGLTAVDVALTLTRRTRTAPIHAVSRHGLLPRAHTTALPADPARPVADPSWPVADPARPAADPSWPVADPAAEGSAAGSATGIPAAAGQCTLAQVVRQVRAAAAEAADWRSAVDALRPHLDPVWQRLTVADRQRFLRHAARWWEVHRHRMAPPVAAAVSRLRTTGCLLAGAGDVVRVEPTGDRLAVTVQRPDATTTVHRVGAIVNCTGPRSALHLPLVRALVADGYARPDALGLGVAVDAGGAVDDPAIRVVGPARRGTLWETTAVPEIRAQAEALAAAVRSVAERRPALV